MSKKHKKKKQTGKIVAAVIMGIIILAAVVAGCVILLKELADIDDENETTTEVGSQGGIDIETATTTEEIETTVEATDEPDVIIIDIPAETTTEAPTEAPTTVPTTQPEDTRVNRYIFLGDSRFVGMDEIDDDSVDITIAEIGEGYYYLLKMTDKVLSLGNKQTALIIGLGVNDMPYLIDEYAVAINKLANEYPGPVYYTTVNPVNEDQEYNYGYNKKNSDIDYFNKAIIPKLSPSIKIIDTNAYLKSVGYSCTDGIHYKNETYRKVYNYIKMNLTLDN